MTYRDKFQRYVDFVLNPSNKSKTNQWVKKAVQRYLRDVEKSKNEDYPFEMNWELVERFCSFAELLKQSKDKWAGQPLHLEDWQIFIFGNIYGWVHKETRLRRFRKAFIYVSRKNGKDVALDTVIPTPDGYKTMADIHPGDYVFGDDGEPVKVLWESEIFHNNPCYRITFNNGDVITAGEGHLWNVWDTSYKHTGWVTRDTRSLYEEFIRYSARRIDVKFRLPDSPAINYAEKKLPVDPYLMGYWLGDGARKSPSITVGKQDWPNLKAHLDSLNIDYKLVERETIYQVNLCTADNHHWKNPNPFSKALREAGVWEDKHIPEIYLTASVKQRTALLQGLMDTDGYCSVKGQCQFSQKEGRLVEDFYRLLNSLGINYTVRHYDAVCTNTGTLTPSVSVSFFVDRDHSCFSLERKTARLKKCLKKATRVRIDRIEPVPTVDTKCIAVDNESKLFCIGNHNTVTHNSLMCAVPAIWDLLSTPGAEVCCAANKREQSKRVWDDAANMIRQNSSLSKRLTIKESTSHIINLKLAGKMEALSNDKRNFDGKNPSLIIADELAAMANYDIIKILQSGQGSRTEPLLLEITSGSDNLQSAGKQEFDRSCKILDDIYQDDSFFCILYCIEDNDKWDDEKVWCKANPMMLTDSEVVNMDTFRKLALEAKQNPSLRQEFITKQCARWSKPLKSWIQPEVWRKCEANPATFDESQPYCAIGAVDLSKISDLTAFSICIYQNGNFFLKHRFYFPIEQLQKKIHEDNELWDYWREHNYVTATEGSVINYDQMYQDIREARDKYKLREVLYDPYNAQNTLIANLDQEMTLVEVPQNIKNLSPYIKSMEEEIYKGTIKDPNPVMKWMMSNAEVLRDPNDNIKIVKPDCNAGSPKRIDGVITSAMSLGRMKQLIAAGEIDLRSNEERMQSMKSMLSKLKWN